MNSRRDRAVCVLALISLLGAAFTASQTRASAAAVSVPTNGVVLDAYGGLHAFGNANINTTGAPYWNGWDVARSVAVISDGSGGWTLDGFGGIHNWGGAPSIASPSYTPGVDNARGLYVLPDHRSGYLLDSHGVLHPFGSNAPVLAGAPAWNWDIARGLDIHLSAAGVPDGGATLDGFGGLHSFGRYPAATPTNPYTPGHDVALRLHSVSGMPYAVSRFGIVNDASGGRIGTDWTSYADWGSWDIQRDLVLVPHSSSNLSAQPVTRAARAAFSDYLGKNGGATLDGFGGVHPFGRALIDTNGAPYWPNWDIARSMSLVGDGSGGWTLDGFGGIHAWGAARLIATPAYWPKWDIARALYVLPDQRSGYVLDGYGGLHAFGPNAPQFGDTAHWQGWDVARGLDIHLNGSGVPDGGAILDAFGGLHPFGNYYPTSKDVEYWAGKDLYLKLHSVGGAPYVVERWGQVDHIAAAIQPDWTGYGDWGAQDILRDELVLGSASPYTVTQPVSVAAFATFTNTAYQGFASYTPLSFADAMLSFPGVNAPVVGPNEYALERWQRAEGGGAGCDGQAPNVEPWIYSAGPAANPLNTTRAEPGATDWNSVHVRIFHDYQGVTCWAWGVKASGDTLTNGYYGAIIAALRNPSLDYATQCVNLARAVGGTPWGTGDFERWC